MAKKKFKSVTEMVDKTTSQSFKELFKKAADEIRATIKNAPPHTCRRKLIGTISRVAPGRRKVLSKIYWCKICHRDMP